MSPNPFPTAYDPQGTQTVQVHGKGNISATTLTPIGIYNQMQPVVVTAISGERAAEEVRQDPEVETQVATSSTREEHGDPLDFSTRKEGQRLNLEDNTTGAPQVREGHLEPLQQPERYQEAGRNPLREVRRTLSYG